MKVPVSAISMPAGFFLRFAEVWMTGEVGRLDDLLPADVRYHAPPFVDMNRAGLKQLILSFHQAFPDFTITVDKEVSRGDTTYTRWSCAATFGEGPSALQSPPNSESIRSSGSHFIHWQHGEPVEVWHSTDWLGAVRNLVDVLPGYLLLPA